MLAASPHIPSISNESRYTSRFQNQVIDISSCTYSPSYVETIGDSFLRALRTNHAHADVQSANHRSTGSTDNPEPFLYI